MITESLATRTTVPSRPRSSRSNHSITQIDETDDANRKSARSDPTFPPLFMVSSTDLLSKYSSVLSLPFVIIDRLRGPSSSLIVNSPAQYLQARVSFAHHKSQARWFRSLFILFSRYLWFLRLDGPVL